jgi:hypothetical protein
MTSERVLCCSLLENFQRFEGTFPENESSYFFEKAGKFYRQAISSGRNIRHLNTC